MVCLNIDHILKSPLLAAISAGCTVVFYIVLMLYHPNLPHLLLFSLLISGFVFVQMGGKFICSPDDEKPTKKKIIED